MNQDFTVQKKSNICLKKKKKNSCSGVHLKKKILHKQWAKKKIRASWKFPTLPPPPITFLMVRSLIEDTAYLNWCSTKNIFLSSKTFAVLGASSASGFRNLAWTYLQLSQISRPLWEKGGIENRRQRSQTIWGLGSFAPARYGGNNQKCGKWDNSPQEGLECKNTENDGFFL